MADETDNVGVIYAHEVQHGIKIGWTMNYKKTKAAYGRHGDEIKEIRTINVKNETLDQKLKNALCELKLRVTIPNQSTTEVYQINITDLNAVLDYIAEHDDVTTDIVRNIVAPDQHVEIIQMTFGELRIAFGSDYVPFRYQRPSDDTHIASIKSYIEKCYMFNHFDLSQITVALNEHKQYEIIDGMHRCKAIAMMSKEHPAMKQKINIVVYKHISNLYEFITIFRNVNKAKPMAEIYVNPNYIDETRAFIESKLKLTYFKDVVAESKGLSAMISKDKINRFITNENINLLIVDGRIKGLDKNEIYDYITKINEIVVSCFELSFEPYKLSDIDEIPAEKIDEVLVFINTTNDRKYKSVTLMRAIRGILQARNIKTKCKVRKIRKLFMLGLLPCVEIVDMIEKMRKANCYAIE